MFPLQFKNWPSTATFKIFLFLCLSQKYQTAKSREASRSEFAEDLTWVKITLLQLDFHSNSAAC